MNNRYDPPIGENLWQLSEDLTGLAEARLEIGRYIACYHADG